MRARGLPFVLLRLAVVALPLLMAARAEAEPPSASADRALATDLFNQARALAASGNLAEACPKFAESQRLDPGLGTLLNLANCHEALGKTASAWAEMTEALALAERERQPDRIAFAEAHIAALAQRLSRLVIVVPPELQGKDLVVKRDGSVIASVAIGTAMPIDPGAHHVEVSADGFAPWSADVEIADGARRELTVGPLVALPASAPPQPPGPPPPPVAVPADTPPAHPATTSGNGRTAAFVIGATGLVAVGVGTVAGVLAFSKSAQSDSRCSPRCSDEGYALNGQAKTAADIATASFILGAVALGVGVFLYVRSGASSSTKSAAAAAPGGAGALVRF